MGYTVTRFFLFLLIVLTASTTPGAKSFAQAGLSVNSLRIGTHPDKERVVMELSSQTEYKTFTLMGPPRLVVDLPAVSWNAGQANLPPGTLVKTIRHGALQSDVTRVVLELGSQAIIKSAFFLPSDGTNSNRLVIDFQQENGAFDPYKHKTFGNLKSQAGEISSVSMTQVLKLPEEKPKASPKNDYAPAPVFKGKKMVVIDPGHGGQDPGALGAGGAREKDVTLATAKELKSQLEATGRYTVQLTRDKDVFIKLQDRVKIARKLKADLFISLHADSIDKPNVHGASIYTLSNTASDAQTAKLAARENRADLIAGVDLSHEDKEVADILIDLAMRDTMNQSKFFANTVVTKAKGSGIELLERPHRYAGFAVLKAADTPSVLIEMGFMSNRKEVSQLTSPAYRRKIAGAITSGVDAYFSKISKNGQH